MKRWSALFDVYGSQRTGIGHVIRSLTLADHLTKSGARVTFLSPGRKPAKALLVGRFPVISRTASTRKPTPDVIVVDRPDHSSARLAAHRRRWPDAVVVALDYYERGADAADAVINLNRARSSSAPRSGAVKYYEGLEFAILREQFTAARRKRALTRSGLERMVVALGGTDATGWTQLTVKALRLFIDAGGCVDVAGQPKSGGSSRSTMRGLRYHGAVSNLAGLIRHSDAAIVGGGTLMMECACVGVPAIVLPRTPEEVAFSREFVRAGAAVVVQVRRTPSRAAVAAAVDSLLPRFRRREMSKAGRELIDGRGANRVSNIVARLLTERT